MEMALMFLCFLLPAAAFFSFVLGYRTGRQHGEAGEAGILPGRRTANRTPAAGRTRPAQPVVTPEEARAQAIHDNIEAYGTDRKQEDIE